MTEFIEIPLERVQAFRDLLEAARRWRAFCNPSSVHVTWQADLGLVKAIAALDGQPCDHPYSWRAYAGNDAVCGFCGSYPEISATPSGSSPQPN